MQCEPSTSNTITSSVISALVTALVLGLLVALLLLIRKWHQHFKWKRNLAPIINGHQDLMVGATPPRSGISSRAGNSDAGDVMFMEVLGNPMLGRNH